MAGLLVSELAARAGVPPSTVRFYERAGLLPPARRAVNGYRLFDESAVDDLALIGRAKSAGMRLDDVADVVAAWHEGSCRVLRDRLRAHLTAETGRAREQIADLAAFRRKLEAALDRLAARDADADADADARCGPGCECDTVLSPDSSPCEAGAPNGQDAPSGQSTPNGQDAPNGQDSAPAPLPGCLLGRDALASRLGQWRAVAADAEAAERDGDTVRLTLDPAMLPPVAALVAAEAGCCPGARFTLEVAAGLARLTAEIPGIGAELDAQHA